MAPWTLERAPVDPRPVRPELLEGARSGVGLTAVWAVMNACDEGRHAANLAQVTDTPPRPYSR